MKCQTQHCGETAWLSWKFLGNSDQLVAFHHRCAWLSKRAYFKQVSKKAPFGRPGQVHFLVGQVTLQSHPSDGQGIRKVVCQVNH